MKRFLTGAVLVAGVMSHAAPVASAPLLAAGYGIDATGNTSFGIENDGILNTMQSRFDGTLDSYTIWLGPAASDAELRLQMFTGFGTFDIELLATEVFAADALNDGPQVTGGNGRGFYAFSWDLSAYDQQIGKGQRVEFLITQTAGSRTLAISGNDQGLSDPLDRPAATNTFFSDPDTDGLFVGTPNQAIGFALHVEPPVVVDPDPDPDPMTPVPLPAGLPLLLTALGGLAAIRRYRH